MGELQFNKNTQKAREEQNVEPRNTVGQNELYSSLVQHFRFYSDAFRDEEKKRF